MDDTDRVIPRPDASDDGADLKSLDPDAMKLAGMGYKQDLRRNYTVLSVLGVGFSLTNSWWGISAALITGISSGGTVLIIYGIILLALISTCVGISLSELASAYPNAGPHSLHLVPVSDPLHTNRRRWPILLGERARTQAVCQFHLLPDRMAGLGWQHLHHRQCGIGDWRCMRWLLATSSS